MLLDMTAVWVLWEVHLHTIPKPPSLPENRKKEKGNLTVATLFTLEENTSVSVYYRYEARVLDRLYKSVHVVPDGIN